MCIGDVLCTRCSAQTLAGTWRFPLQGYSHMASTLRRTRGVISTHPTLVRPTDSTPVFTPGCLADAPGERGHGTGLRLEWARHGRVRPVCPATGSQLRRLVVKLQRGREPGVLHERRLARLIR